MVAYWFTYDENGAQRWFIATGNIKNDTVVFDELLQTSGPKFGSEFNSDDLVSTNVGQLTLTWSDCSNAIASYTVDGIDGTQNLTRLTSLVGLDCNEGESLSSSLTGSWFDQTHNGEGLVVEVLEDGIALVYWFSYDSDGNQAWFIGTGHQKDKIINISEMLITNGGRFGDDFDPDEVEVNQWGGIQVELGCDFGKLDYTSGLSIYGNGKQTLSRLTSIGEPACEEEAPPNILLVIADDLGLDAFDQYGISTQQPITPILSQLANDGLIFDNAWSSPTCTPTRAGLLTGKYGSKTNMLVPGDVLPVGEISLQSYIRNHLPNKYNDAIIGKWHVGPGANDLNHPASFGISHYAGIISGAVADYENWNLVTNGESVNETDYVTSKLVDLAIDWTGEQQKPWFLWLAFNAPHTPFHLPPENLHDRELSGSQADIDSNPLPYYFAAIESMDSEIGRLLESLDKETRDNTIIIFMGDNGTPRQVIQQPYSGRQAKGTLYQGGINIPFFISGPGVSRKGEYESSLVNTTDLFSTIASLSGVNVDEINDSISFVNLLNKTQPSNRNYQFTELRADNGENWAISDGEYKLIENEAGDQEFYHLTSDPYEDSDLIISGTAPIEIVNQLSTLALQIRQNTESNSP